MDNKIVLIGITGEAMSGKDTFATLVEKQLADKAHVHRFAFADRLKKEVCDALGVPLTYAYEQPYKEHLRPLLQCWGDIRKKVEIGGDMHYWCEQLDTIVGNALVKHRSIGEPCYILVTDVRYPFEAEYLRGYVDCHTFIVKLSNPNKDTTDHNLHSSETSVKGVLADFEIVNDKTLGLENLEFSVDAILSTIESTILSREQTLSDMTLGN